MTREEAIDTLKNGLWWDRKRLDEAIDIAIAALRPHQPGAGGEGVEGQVEI